MCRCRGIRTLAKCPACGEGPENLEWSLWTDDDGKVYRTPPALMGAEGRYQDYVLLDMLAVEWLRPVNSEETFEQIHVSSRPAPKAVVVLVFWTYFETRIERLLRDPSREVIPERVLDDLLSRHNAIGARLDRAYRVLYGTTYFAELEALGFKTVADLLRRVHEARNKFVHGHPEAITPGLVEQLVGGLKEEHEAWIAVFNRRIRNRPKTHGAA